MTNPTKELTGSSLPAHTITYVTNTAQALGALARLTAAVNGAADTETVARDEQGNLMDLNTTGPGPVRVLSMAGKIDGVIEAFVFDLADQAEIDSEVAALYGVAGKTSIDRPSVAKVLTDFDVYGWNADFDERVLDEAGLPTRSWRDLMLAQASLSLGELGVSFYDGLAAAAKRYLGIPVEGKGSIQLSYTLADPLTLEQVKYAAIDAVITCALADEIMSRVNQANLFPTVEVEWNARPFRSRMERRGIYFDTSGWRGELDDHQTSIDEAASKLASMTGGGQNNLFDEIERPTWKPGSPEAVKKILNEYAPEAVKRYLGGRLFEKSDSVGSASLKLLNHPIATMVLLWREHSKTISTYGESFMAFVRSDGRIHARYLQNIVSTGRLSSSKPNMQNIDPTMKHYYRPENTFVRIDGKWQIDPEARVFVMGDLSQAELRFAAEITGDAALTEAFNRGADMHAVTAARMFHVDMDELKTTDPVRYKLFRARGKTMNFAIIYGLGPRALAERLVLDAIDELVKTNGRPPTDEEIEAATTTKEEAAEFQRLYLAAFPKVAEWLSARDAYVKGLATQPPRCDFTLSLKLQRLLPLIKAAKKVMTGRVLDTHPELAAKVQSEEAIRSLLTIDLGRAPTSEEVEDELARQLEPLLAAIAEDRSTGSDLKDSLEVGEAITSRDIALQIASVDEISAQLTARLGRDPLPEELEEEIVRRADMVDWAESFRAPVILLENGTALSFESRTPLGRRRTFNVGTKKWIDSIIMSVMTARRGNLVEIRKGFEAHSGEKLTMENGATLSREVLKKRFEKKDIRDSFVSYIFKSLGSQTESVCYRAVSDCIGGLGNAYRNAPIQGGVADAVMMAFGLLDERLKAFNEAFPVQSVHDSIVIECAAKDALAVSEVLKSSMVEAMRYFCPSVPAKADIEIATSLDASKDLLESADLDRMFPATEKDGNQVWMEHDAPLSEDLLV